MIRSVDPLFEASKLGPFCWVGYWSNAEAAREEGVPGTRMRMFAGIHMTKRRALRAAVAGYESSLEWPYAGAVVGNG
jgi:hypothetical protein